jgi:ABC-type antimicrobial peptide transport system permease subunit
VAIINETFAERYFPNQNPVGQSLSASVRGDRRDLQIIGLAKDTSAAGLRSASPATVYVSYLQLTGDFPTTLEVRASGSLPQVAAALRRVIQQRLPAAPVEVLPLAAQVNAAMVRERIMATLAGAFGALALLLACVGLYGLLAYSVVRRTKEMGIRIALGAQPSRVVGMVLKRAFDAVIVGVLLGLPAVWMTSRWIQSMLFGLNPADSATAAAAIGLLMTAALVAAYLPARRAARLDPLVALRYE